MSGHNKWSSIKHKKAKTDAQKGKSFAKVSREIIVAAKSGGGDPDMNPRLRLALHKARDVNMPKDNIQRAIDKGVGGGEGANLEEIYYEAYGPNGVAILIHTLTDNRNRTIPNLRTIMSKGGGSMAEQGSVGYLFETKGYFLFDSDVSEDQVIDIATSAGADDVDVQSDGSIEVLSESDVFESVRGAFEDAGIGFSEASITKLPQTTIELDFKTAEKIINLIDQLENDDDVQNVYANYMIPDAIMAQLVE